MLPGDLGFRLACYREFGWTPQEVKQALYDYPQECALLAIHFEETARYQAEQAEKQRKEAERQRRRTQAATADEGWVVEDEVGADDDIDYYDALQMGLVKDDSTWPPASTSPST